MDCPRRYELIQAATRDLPDTEMERITGHISSCTRCAAVMESLEHGRLEFLRRHPFEKTAPAVMAEADRRLSRRFVLFRLAPAAAAAAVLIVLAFTLYRPSPPTTRVKGAVSLDVFVQNGTGAVQGRDGGLYHAQDRIQFTYSSGANRYLFLLSLDERGRISNFNYQGTKESVPIVPGNNRVLEGSIILDDYVGPERVFGVFSETPLQEDKLRAAAEEAYAGIQRRKRSVRDLSALPLDYPQATILLEKD